MYCQAIRYDTKTRRQETIRQDLFLDILTRRQQEEEFKNQKQVEEFKKQKQEKDQEKQQEEEYKKKLKKRQQEEDDLFLAMLTRRQQKEKYKKQEEEEDKKRQEEDKKKQQKEDKKRQQQKEDKKRQEEEEQNFNSRSQQFLDLLHSFEKGPTEKTTENERNDDDTSFSAVIVGNSSTFKVKFIKSKDTTKSKVENETSKFRKSQYAVEAISTQPLPQVFKKERNRPPPVPLKVCRDPPPPPVYHPVPPRGSNINQNSPEDENRSKYSKIDKCIFYMCCGVCILCCDKY